MNILERVWMALLSSICNSLNNEEGFSVSVCWRDKLLCEVGWAATLLSTPLFSTNSISGNHPAMLLLRWILFKLMFMSGVVKIQANCPTWLHLTACHYHFATQCIPTPLAWHFHNLPGFLLKLMVALTLYFEMPAALLVLAPWQCVRLFAAGVQIFLQVSQSSLPKQ